MYWIVELSIGLGLTVSLARCGLRKSSDTNLASCQSAVTTKGLVLPKADATATGQSYYVASVYPIMKSANRCGQCHTPGGEESPYPFGDTTSSGNAYAAAVKEVASFASITSSNLWIFGTKNGGQSNHCGVVNCQDVDGAFAATLTAWAQAEQGQAVTGGSSGSTSAQQCTPAIQPGPGASPTPTATAGSFVMVGLPVEITNHILNATGATTSLPTTAMTASPAPADHYIEFDLSTAPGAPPGAKAVFLIQRNVVATAQTNGAYYVANLSVMTPTAFHLKGIHLAMINGSNTSQWDDWDDLDTDIPVDTTFPGKLLGTEWQILPSLGVTGDALQLSIIGAGTPTGKQASAANPNFVTKGDGTNSKR